MPKALPIVLACVFYTYDLVTIAIEYVDAVSTPDRS